MAQATSITKENSPTSYSMSYSKSVNAGMSAALAATTALSKPKQDHNVNQSQKVAVINKPPQFHKDEEAIGHVPRSKYFHHAGQHKKRHDGNESIQSQYQTCVESPEEIAKYIAERKKRYPTQANIEKKERELAEQAARGQVIQRPQPYAARKTSIYSTYQNPWQKPDKRAQFQNAAGGQAVRRFQPYTIRKTRISDNYQNSKSDPKQRPDKRAQLQNPRQCITSDLFVAARAAGAPDFVLTNVQPDPIPQQPRKKASICRFYQRGRCRNGERCSFLHEKQVSQPTEKNEELAPDLQLLPSRTGNLLRMLLEKDIREERNALLQSIRYIVRKNFFGVVTNDALEAERRRGGPAIVELEPEQSDALGIVDPGYGSCTEE